VPSLFPQVYKKKFINEEQTSARYNRNVKRQEAKLKILPVDSFLDILLEDSEFNTLNTLVCTESKSVHVACQAGLDYHNKDSFQFECVFNKSNNDVSTQALIPIEYNYTFKKPNSINVSCGSDVSSIFHTF
jgi:hypothetical protein